MSINKTSNLSHQGLARSAGVIGFATLCSRILGFIRDMVIARLFGVYIYAQAFVIAFKIPNLLRDLLGEGAANAAIIPVLTEYSVKRTKEEFWALANVLMNVILVVLCGVTILGVVFAPLMVRLIAPGFAASPEKLAATILLTRLVFPYILLIGLAAYAMAILNTLKHFSVPAFSPCLLNISIIACALIWGEGVKGLAAGVLVGGLLQLAVQIPVLYKKGFRFGFKRDLGHPAIKQIGGLMAPRLFSSAIYHLNNFVDSIFGSLAFIVGEGAVAALYFSYRLIQFPLGIFSNSLSQAILPTFSQQALEPDREKLKATLNFGLKMIFFLMVPASAAFMVLSGPLVKNLFGGGRFDLHSVRMTADALFFYSIGLAAYGGVKMLQNCFFSLKDTVTPAKISVLALIINVGLNAILISPMKISGIALATSISGITSFCALFYILQKRINGFDCRPLFIVALKVILASIGMAAVCYSASRLDPAIHNHLLDRAFKLLFPIVCGVAAYAGLCSALKVEEMRKLAVWVKGSKPAI
ncbi:MAG: murein biosynthesis integral membrane protein MurJ [Candidatus Omnitrophica bacterium]|jgi:putative peptidoglycan lipid II flippase|nr:murein biosynthesis integral membrane protein MurJ [Candidatus Omnitrophota bacterium]MDD5079432.1 murein biosynthesis integral membrane protein MurJ [Candidatus Omnitrophota bacterium]